MVKRGAIGATCVAVAGVMSIWFPFCSGLCPFMGSAAAAGVARPLEEVPRLGIVDNNAPAGVCQTVRLEELWRVDGEKDLGRPLGQVSLVRQGPDSSICLLEGGREIHVYSNDGQYLRSLSLAHDVPGPKDMIVSFMFLADDTIGVVRRGQFDIQKLSMGGEAAGRIRVHGSCETGLILPFDGDACGGRIMLAGRSGHSEPLGGTSMKERYTYVLSCVTSDGVEKVRLFQTQRDYDVGGLRLQEQAEYFPAPERWALGRDGHVYVAPKRDDYDINVYAPDGKLERVIRCECAVPQRNPAQMARCQAAKDEWLRSRGGGEIELADAEPVVQSIRAWDDGTIWVLRAGGAQEQPAGVMLTYDVFDATGHLVRQVQIACDGDGERDGMFLVGRNRFVRVSPAHRPMGGMRGSLAILPPGDETARTEVTCYRAEP